MSEKIEQQLSVILIELFPVHNGLIFILEEPIPLEKYRILDTKVFNEIQLLGTHHFSTFTYVTLF